MHRRAARLENFDTTYFPIDNNKIIFIHYFITRQPLLIGDTYISVQASPQHYCQPKESLGFIHEYESVEMMIGNGLHPSALGCPKEFDKPWYKDSVGSFVPIKICFKIISIIYENKKSEILPDQKERIDLVMRYIKYMVLA